MTGLVMKDFMLLKRQGRYYLIVVALACVMSFTGNESFSSFITTYLTFMITMFSFSSFSYDEYDNGMSLLMALPSGRRDYVKAKYTFSTLLIMGGWITGVLLHTALYLIRFSAEEYLDILPFEPVYLLICLMYSSFAFPVIMKYGAEKGRNITFMMLAVLAIGVFCAVKLNIRIPALTSLNQLSVTSPMMFLIPLAILCAAVMGISYLLSLRIIEKKEF